MVLGTSSGAGKSWLATALCRWYSDQGLKVAPFKAQNMSNNARVVPGPGGVMGEIGSAQYFQALAARAEPDVRMNPLLLKPEADTRSQAVLLGQVRADLSALPWRSRSEQVWPQIAAALDALRAENDLLVIEGAGSPAEINLQASDIVNLRVARHAQARCLLVADIDRGGAFAHLYGTWALLPEADRALIRGFVLNKFRGDASLLDPAPQQLQALTGMPCAALIPMQWRHGLPEEDGCFDDRNPPPGGGGAAQTTVAVVAYPRISNLDEFQPLRNLPGLRLLWARSAADLAGLKTSDWLILPGSKASAADLAWLRAQALDQAIAAHAARGGMLLGLCGGLQMLGEALIDDAGIDGNAPGLGLLPLVTRFAPVKTVRRSRVRFGAVPGAWAALSGLTVSGYEIRHGQTALHPGMVAAGAVARELIPGLAWQNGAGNVLGLYLHGLFEDPAALQALLGHAGAALLPGLDAVFDGLARTADASFAPGFLRGLIDAPSSPRQKRGEIDDYFKSKFSGFSSEHLIGLLEERDARTRTAAATVLGERKSLEAIAALCQRLSKEKALYSKMAVSEALANIGVSALPEMTQYIGKIGKNQHKELPGEIFKKWNYPLPRDIVIRTIVKIGTPALPHLCNTLLNADSSVAAEVIDAIGHISFYGKDHHSLDVLIAALDKYEHPAVDAVVPWKILRALQAFPQQQSLDVLRKYFLDSNDPQLRREAARSLGQLGADGILVLGSNDPDSLVRKMIKMGLDRIKESIINGKH